MVQHHICTSGKPESRYGRFKLDVLSMSIFK